MVATDLLATTPNGEDGSSCSCSSRRVVVENNDNRSEPLPTTNSSSSKVFYKIFFHSKAALLILIISTFLSFGIASTIGVIPDVVAERYARLRYGYDSDQLCHTFDRSEKPVACQRGSDDAQGMAAWSMLIMSTCTLLFNPVIGSMSDTYGRRYIILASLFLQMASPLALVLLQLIPTMDPWVYYASYSLVGIINYLSTVFASISDVISSATTDNNTNEDMKTPSFGLVLAGFYAGFALGPSLVEFMDHLAVSVVSFLLVLTAFVLALTILPETLPQQQQPFTSSPPTTTQVLASSLSCKEDILAKISQLYSFFKWILLRPFHELSILNRNWMTRLVTTSSFLSAMVYASDASLVLYYIEDQLNVRDHDIALMFLCCGSLGILSQAFLLEPLLDLFQKGCCCCGSGRRRCARTRRLVAHDNLPLPQEEPSLGLSSSRARTSLSSSERLLESSEDGGGGEWDNRHDISNDDDNPPNNKDDYWSRTESEKYLVLLTFLSGTIHNLLYGMAQHYPSQSKLIIYLALSLSEFTKLNYPILCSLASKSIATSSDTHHNRHQWNPTDSHDVVDVDGDGDGNDHDHGSAIHVDGDDNDNNHVHNTHGKPNGTLDSSPAVQEVNTTTTTTTNEEDTRIPIRENRNDNDETTHEEQGRLQGALFATNAIGNSIGPISAEFVYNLTKDNSDPSRRQESIIFRFLDWGPGTMFLYLSILYGMGMIVVSCIPIRKQQGRQCCQQRHNNNNNTRQANDAQCQYGSSNSRDDGNSAADMESNNNALQQPLLLEHNS